MTETARPLFWSKRGDVACADHAPAPASSQWQSSGWCVIPKTHVLRHRLIYQCPVCVGGRPHRRRGRAATSGTTMPSVESGPLVLSVDDREEALNVRERLLRDGGFDVANASTVYEALQTAYELQPRVILLDAHVPERDGRQFCQMLKADRALRDIPVILISAVVPDASRKPVSVGAFGVLREPVDPQSLVRAVRSAIAL